MGCFGCQTNSSENKLNDSLEEIKTQEYIDSFKESRIEKINDAIDNEYQLRSNTASPVKITKASLITDEYGSTDAAVTLQNISKKSTDGIKVGWILKNNFGDKIQTIHDGGITQHTLKPGQSRTCQWNISSTTATKISAYVYSVHFSDGTLWENKGR
jgi:hypothetical protein